MLLQQPGYHRCQVGAQRLVVIGNGSFVDQLEGLDDERLLVYASSPRAGHHKSVNYSSHVCSLLKTLKQELDTRSAELNRRKRKPKKKSLLSLNSFLHVCSKWKLVSHSLNVNPFPASFVNWRCRLQLVEVTREGSTVMTWIGSLDTDPHVSPCTWPALC